MDRFGERFYFLCAWEQGWKADMMSALGESVSFGRFLSEPLEWGKWSAFAHNRYLEEASRQSRPGSVAQKKAFFIRNPSLLLYPASGMSSPVCRLTGNRK